MLNKNKIEERIERIEKQKAHFKDELEKVKVALTQLPQFIASCDGGIQELRLMHAEIDKPEEKKPEK